MTDTMFKFAGTAKPHLDAPPDVLGDGVLLGAELHVTATVAVTAITLKTTKDGDVVRTYTLAATSVHDVIDDGGIRIGGDDR